MTDLLDAVQALTRTTVEHIKPSDDTGRPLPTHTCAQLCNGLSTHTVESPSLLVQLAEAVKPSTNTTAGSSSLAHTRNIIDGTALFHLAKISSAIRDWCRMAEVTPGHNPVTNLNAWYVAFTRYDNDPEWRIRELTKWARTITNILKPPVREELPYPCPVHHTDQWVDDMGNGGNHPLVLEYQRGEDGQVIDPRVRCRDAVCAVSWEGEDAMSELGDEVEEKRGEMDWKEVPR
ncbi:hypothetical protein [Plantibacter sp. M259]|uniref:DUF7341 domain-containing protein n=1 Tax=Plantibacter sp. M259 TaxID=2583822 RepID=UPI001110B02D|nr:hypothetical protein [Plantibacter sp. M259]